MRRKAKEGMKITDKEAAVDQFGEQEKQYSKRFYRYISVRLSRHLAKTPITPNQVSMLGLILSIVAGYFFATGQYLNLIIASLLGQVIILTDYMDGNVARFKGMSSIMGKMLEGLVDRMSDVFIFFGILWGLYITTSNPLVWIVGFIAIAARFQVEVTRYMFYKINTYLKKGAEIKQGSGIIKEFLFTRTLIYALMLIASVLNMLYYFLIFIAVYGWLFYLGTSYLFCKKLRDAEERERR